MLTHLTELRAHRQHKRLQGRHGRPLSSCAPLYPRFHNVFDMNIIMEWASLLRLKDWLAEELGLASLC